MTTDDTGSILTPEAVAQQRWLCEQNGYDQVVILADSHEALRAALAAAEERAERFSAMVDDLDHLAETRMVALAAAEAERDQAQATARAAVADLRTVCDERDQAIMLHNDAQDYITHVEAQVRMLRGYAIRAWTLMRKDYEQKPLGAALGEKNDA